MDTTDPLSVAVIGKPDPTLVLFLNEVPHLAKLLDIDLFNFASLWTESLNGRTAERGRRLVTATAFASISSLTFDYTIFGADGTPTFGTIHPMSSQICTTATMRIKLIGK